MTITMRNLPETERPRERMMQLGADSMSVVELIAIILGSGTKTMPVLPLAQTIMAHFGTLEKLAEASIEELCQIHGLGQAKAIQLKAAITLGLRASREAGADR